MTNGRYTFEIAPQFVDFQHKIKQDKTTEECHQSVAKEGSYSALSALPFKTI